MLKTMNLNEHRYVLQTTNPISRIQSSANFDK